jgi:hypothetical protein
MFDLLRSDDRDSPVAIGGIGGSGTRVVAELLARCGLHIGEDLNDPNDNLWFTLLFKRVETLDLTDDQFERVMRLFFARMRGEDVADRLVDLPFLNGLTASRPDHDQPWLEARLARFLASPAPGSSPRRWGWKEPNTQIVCDRLLRAEPHLRYIHVVRNGFDMAFSTNQNQLRLWGRWIMGRDIAVTPRNSLAFWCAAHRRLETIAERFPERFLFVRFEALLDDPATFGGEIARFAGLPPSHELERELAQGLVRRDAVSARPTYTEADFNEDDIRYAATWGYSIANR